MDREKIDDLKEQYPDLAEKLEQLAKEHEFIGVVHTQAGVAIFRRPKPAEYRRHFAMIFDEKDRALSLEVLARATVVHPSKQEFDKWLSEWPGIPSACSETLMELSGSAKAARGKG
jgi:hypothetical protein